MIKHSMMRLSFGCSRLSYEDYLHIMCLFLLVFRRKRGDLIRVYKILSQDNSAVGHLFSLNVETRILQGKDSSCLLREY